MVQKLSGGRYLDGLNAPLVLGYGTTETPEFQRQSRDFAAAVKAAVAKLCRELIRGRRRQCGISNCWKRSPIPTG